MRGLPRRAADAQPAQRRRQASPASIRSARRSSSARAPVQRRPGRAAERRLSRDAPSISSGASPRCASQTPPQTSRPQRALGEAVRVPRHAAERPRAAVRRCRAGRAGARPSTCRRRCARPPQQVLGVARAARREPDRRRREAGVRALRRAVRAARLRPARRRRFRRHASAPKTPAPAGDLKAALLVFRQVLKAWADDTAPAARAAPPLVAGRAASGSTPQARRHAPFRTRRHQASRQRARGRGRRAAAAAPPLSPEQATSLAKSVATALAAPRRAGSSRFGRPATAARRRPIAARRSPRSRRRAPRSRPTRRRTRPPSACSPQPTARSRARPCCRPPRCRTSRRAAHRSGRAALDLRGAVRDAAGHRHRAVRGEPRRHAARSTSAGADLARALLARSSSRWGRCMRWSRSPASAPASRSGPSAHATAARLNEQRRDAERCAARGRARAGRLSVPRRRAAGCRAAGRARPLHGSRHMTSLPLAVALQYDKSRGAGAARRSRRGAARPARRSWRWRASMACRSRRTRRSPRRWRRSSSATIFPKRFIARSPRC